MTLIDPTPYAVLAKAAYHSAHDIDVGSYRARVDDSPLGHALAIAGTDDIRTVITDLEAWLPTWADEIGAWVSRSFWKTVEGAWPEIQALDKFGQSPQVITGHSLGAVLALYTAAKLCIAGRPPLAVIVFASPRACIGDALFRLFVKYGVRVQIYRLGEDDVSFVPPGFDPAGPIIQLSPSTGSLLGDHDLDNIIAALPSGATS